ncbi:MAG: sigma-70 family RNA polymerase sigma factor [Betaproteobacteria bacterium]|nr:sigma-70 family RNA polymerase sigma factor [Betaproteobacteria bacterium]
MNARKRQPPPEEKKSFQGFSSRLTGAAGEAETGGELAAEGAGGGDAGEGLMEEEAEAEAGKADFFEDVTCFYLNQIGGKPLLTPEEEQVYARQARAGDPAARQVMIERNLRMVVKIAKRYLYHGVPFLDLIEEGNIGLIYALDRFDPERGVRFSTYATWWVRQAIERGIMNQSRTIRLPGNVFKKISRIRRALRKMEQESPQEHRIAKVAAQLGVPADEVRRVLYLSENIVSLDIPLDAGSGYSFGDFIAADEGDDPETQLQEQEINNLVARWMKRLTIRQREIVERRYGFNGQEPSTLTNIALDLGLTCERVRQIQREALECIRRILKEGGLGQESLL